MAKKQVLIVGSAAAASSAFEAGKFGYIKDHGTFAAQNALTAGDKDVSAFYGTSNVGPISHGDVKTVATYVYSAGTAQVSKALVVLESDNSAYVKIINTTAGTMNLPVKTFEATGAANAEAAADAIKALMDTEFAKSDSPFYGFSAADVGSDAGINITAPIDSHFRLATNDASSITYTTAAVPSNGTEAKVKVLEKEANTDSGVWGRAGSAATFKQPTSVVSGNYDLVKIAGTKSSNSKAVGNARNYDDFIIWIAVPAGQSTVTDDIMVTQLSKLIAV